MSPNVRGNMYLLKSHSNLVKSLNVLGNMYLVKGYNILRIGMSVTYYFKMIHTS